MNITADQNSGWNFMLLFAALWLAISAVLSLASGWRILAGRYASKDSVEGERFRFRSGAVGWGMLPVNYSHCLFGTVGPAALALKVLFIFGFLQPRLVIPWSAMENCEYATFYMFPCVKIQVAGFSGSIRFYGSFGKAVLNAWSAARGLAGFRVPLG